MVWITRLPIPWMPSMMPLSPISEARRMPAGRWFDPSMTMAGSQVAIRIALLGEALRAERAAPRRRMSSFRSKTSRLGLS